MGSAEEKLDGALTSQEISSKDGQQITDNLIYEKWRDDGKYNHKKRDIEKKIKKANAAKKPKKNLNINGNQQCGK